MVLTRPIARASTSNTLSRVCSVWLKGAVTARRIRCEPFPVNTMSEQWRGREGSRVIEIQAVRRALAQLRAEERTVWAVLAWERLARRILVRTRALAIAALCDELLAAEMLTPDDDVSVGQAVAAMLVGERGADRGESGHRW